MSHMPNLPSSECRNAVGSFPDSPERLATLRLIPEVSTFLTLRKYKHTQIAEG